MKKLLTLSFLLLAGLFSVAQPCYWVFLADKQGTTFDPYTYFDAKAIERYSQCGADLYDVSNYPLNGGYVSQVEALATEEVGASRWLNAVAVLATPSQVDAIEALPFVLRVQAIEGDMQLASRPAPSADEAEAAMAASGSPLLSDQLVRMQGQMFREKGIDGSGIRIAVLDAGFPRVNTHRAFKHLRDNHRILDTWNFPNRKADVYGWNSHGLSTLSCITGMAGGQILGLATGAEFLLYRTEVDLEPFKEEVWWMMGMERADQHGANIISSSLGYGKERYYTKDMDGTSYVAQAANMAARKGILVCNSAGNEADSRQWKTIITPSDADSVLCVGGIESDNNAYHHIDFSSFGPSADGRLKPNVSAYGHALAASKASDSSLAWVYGTSFSCPLTAGFAACAWQTMREKTAMQMMQELQQSADLYPYFDYALGYGVPQASYFVGQQAKATPTFFLRDSDRYVEAHILSAPQESAKCQLFFNKQRANGTLEQYGSLEFEGTQGAVVRFHKSDIGNCKLNVSFLGYTDSYRVPKSDPLFQANPGGRLSPDVVDPNVTNSMYHFKKSTTPYNRTDSDLRPWNFGSNARWRGDLYFQIGDMVKVVSDERPIKPWSPTLHVGGRLMFAPAKAYSLGLGLDFAKAQYRLDADKSNPLDLLLHTDIAPASAKKYIHNEYSLELFQRVRFSGGGLLGKGVHWDLGAYVSLGNYDYQVDYTSIPYASSAKSNWHNPQYVDNYKVNFGLTTRLSYDFFGIYARFRATHLFTRYELIPDSPSSFLLNLPRLEVGIQLNL